MPQVTLEIALILKIEFLLFCLVSMVHITYSARGLAMNFFGYNRKWNVHGQEKINIGVILQVNSWYLISISGANHIITRYTCTSRTELHVRLAFVEFSPGSICLSGILESLVCQHTHTRFQENCQYPTVTWVLSVLPCQGTVLLKNRLFSGQGCKVQTVVVLG